MSLRSANTSVRVHGHVLDLITGGDFKPGDRLNEVHLAAALDVSRTPLREALTRLAAEGFVEVRPKLGFFVRRLQPDEIADIYSIRAILDPAALRLAGLPSAEQLDRLDRLNEDLVAASDIDQIIDLDDRWHLELLAGCPNQTLLDLIRQFMQRTRALERLYMQEHTGVATTEHEDILRALRAEDMPRAVGALRQNMQSAVPALTEWLRRYSP